MTEGLLAEAQDCSDGWNQHRWTHSSSWNMLITAWDSQAACRGLHGRL